jgi:hypothetical protein
VTPSPNSYEEISEVLQGIIQEALLDSQTYEWLSMTCRVLGPLERSDELDQAELGHAFDPLLVLLNQDDPYDD